VTALRGAGPPGSAAGGGRAAVPVPVNPEALGAPRGFSHGMLAPAGGRLLCVAGQIATDGAGRLAAESFPAQFERALANVLAVVREAGGGPEHVVRLTIYVTDRRQYLASLEAVGEGYRRLMGKRYPAMALVEVAGLLAPGALVEIEGTAVVP
jgi:enamine deaminase RidA (YjgF/YER057c/UK114 family)